MRIVVALGGNALLERGEKPDSQIQLHHIHAAVAALAPIATDNEVVITHGNGPQVGLLALESAGDVSLSRPYPFDVLGAETQGMIGYWLSQALQNTLPDRSVAAFITQTLVSVADPAFANPSKFVGPVYERGRSETACRRRGLDGQARRKPLASRRAVAAAPRHRGDRAHPSALRRGCRDRLRRGRRGAGHSQR